MRRAAFRGDDCLQRALGPDGKLIVGWLAIDQVLARLCEWMLVCELRACARHLFVNREQQADLVDAFEAQLFGGRNLSRDNSFRIAGTPSVDKLAVFA